MLNFSLSMYLTLTVCCTPLMEGIGFVVCRLQPCFQTSHTISEHVVVILIRFNKSDPPISVVITYGSTSPSVCLIYSWKKTSISSCRQLWTQYLRGRWLCSWVIWILRYRIAVAQISLMTHHNLARVHQRFRGRWISSHLQPNWLHFNFQSVQDISEGCSLMGRLYIA